MSATKGKPRRASLQAVRLDVQKQQDSSTLLGKTTDKIKANDVIWGFFQKRPVRDQ